MAEFDDFLSLDMRVGTVIEAALLPKARVPAIKMKIDFGELGILQSSAQITKRYHPEMMIGKQIVGITNFPPRLIAGYKSEVLVMGGLPEEGDVVLLRLDEAMPNGTKIG